ncbi:Protein N-acetyltransferase, RimJ/RimL family [Lutibacter oricola]|uniref:Protein N-acetyltransferase, RimJ/RimL family n=1 Tax=Lutibacter oricola TaxID=762486 RepID=A0A1H3F6I5_9FLAO|nr:GNAT family protein [Lutibacter oricola]SDX86592.1 Protein N-acetyltransferase, RimJ/RimL family [Lutibacter oricola]
MIKTERILIRPIKPSDSKKVYSYRSDSNTNKFQNWIPKSIIDVDAFIAKNPQEFNKPETWFQVVIINNKNNEIIGDIGIHFIDSYQCELGITLDKKHHGKGYASEALKGVINYLFNKLDKHRITTSIDPKNANSIKLVERIGFRKEAHFKQSLLINNKWVDDIIYAILKKEWI